ncbi:MAG TPA: hypothetical protein DCP69_04365 [Candidatus Omnitrophica bacterium]|nr:hypothetical protein [Candidatus Omnitrophota bacterium]
MRTISTLEPTRYEIELVYDGGSEDPAHDGNGYGQRYLVAYSVGRSARALRDTVRDPKRWTAIERISGQKAFMQISPNRVSDGYERNGWTIRFSGRTQRDIRGHGGDELPFILDES